ncbi:hypothetical protein [Streptomyces sp. NPDC002758]
MSTVPQGQGGQDRPAISIRIARLTLHDPTNSPSLQAELAKAVESHLVGPLGDPPVAAELGQRIAATVLTRLSRQREPR